MKNPAAGGGHWLDVAPGRLAGWVEGFAARHGGIVSVSGGTDQVTFAAADGSLAECHPPFPPVPRAGPRAQAPPPTDVVPAVVPAAAVPADAVPAVVPAAVPADASAAAELVAEHALRDRTVGVLLVRLGGYAVGVFAGAPPRLVASKTGSRLVHGRSAAGGWSQHRFARRREKQASEALGAAAAAAANVLGAAGPLDAVVLGGDRRAMDALRDDPRIASYLSRADARFLTVPDPKLSVLKDTPRAWSAIRIRLIEAAGTDSVE